MRGEMAGRGARLAMMAALAASLGLAGCAQVDDDLFGPAPHKAKPQAVSSDETTAPAAPAPASDEPSAAPSDEDASNFAPHIREISFEPVDDTGTAAGKAASSLHDKAADIESKTIDNAQHLGQVRAQNASLVASYQAERASILTTLQVGTTPANPDLVGKWNNAQSDLDKLTTGLNDTATIGSQAAADSSTASAIVQQIESASAGAGDADKRALDTLDDETRQMIVSIDRLRKEVSSDVPRQTQFISSERANLAQLQATIRTGEPVGANGAPVARAQSAPAPGSVAAASGAPIVVIKFDQPKVDYQQSLYAALNQALQAKPSANFEVLAVAPTASSVKAMAAAQSAAKQHATDVMKTMTAMGVPAARVMVASLTDPSVQSGEVRVFVR